MSNNLCIGIRQFLLMLLLTALFLSGCFINPKKSSESTGPQASSSQETSLINDQRSIEELRKNIPADKREANDALKEIMSLMGEVKHPPAYHRDRFDRHMRSLRDKHRRDMRKTREAFNLAERQKRDRFTENQRRDRERFVKRKSSEERRKDFFSRESLAREAFFSRQREDRERFEAEMSEKEDNFNAFFRERNDEFYRELMLYSERYREQLGP